MALIGHVVASRLAGLETWLLGLMSGSPSALNLFSWDRCTSLRASQVRPVRRRSQNELVLGIVRPTSASHRSEPSHYGLPRQNWHNNINPPEMPHDRSANHRGTSPWTRHASPGHLWITRCITREFLCTTGAPALGRCGRSRRKGSSASWPRGGSTQRPVDWPPPKNHGNGSGWPAVAWPPGGGSFPAAALSPWSAGPGPSESRRLGRTPSRHPPR